VTDHFQDAPLRLLDASGVLHQDERLPVDLDSLDPVALYRNMVLTRRLDTEAIALQRQGELGLWPSLLGQEAQVGAASALRGKTWCFPRTASTA